MSESVTLRVPAEEAARLRATLEESLAEIDHLRERMRLDQIEIERSQERTRAMLAELNATPAPEPKAA